MPGRKGEAINHDCKARGFLLDDFGIGDVLLLEVDAPFFRVG
jgi:hypothetical protein